MDRVAVTAHPHWPLFDLRVRTPRLELRPVQEADMGPLCDLIDAGLHDPATMPFYVAFTDTPAPLRDWDSSRYWFRCWADWQPDRWTLPLAVLEDGRHVGQQTVTAHDFPRRRTVVTGSWVGGAHQGRGIGREMRSATLHLAFAALGARRAETEAFHDNVASRRVTESLGYRPNGEDLRVRRGRADRVLRYVLERDDWEGGRRRDVEVTGLEAALPLLGLEGA